MDLYDYYEEYLKSSSSSSEEESGSKTERGRKKNIEYTLREVKSARGPPKRKRFTEFNRYGIDSSEDDSTEKKERYISDDSSDSSTDEESVGKKLDSPKKNPRKISTKHFVNKKEKYETIISKEKTKISVTNLSMENLIEIAKMNEDLKLDQQIAGMFQKLCKSGNFYF